MDSEPVRPSLAEVAARLEAEALRDGDAAPDAAGRPPDPTGADTTGTTRSRQGAEATEGMTSASPTVASPAGIAAVGAEASNSPDAASAEDAGEEPRRAARQLDGAWIGGVCTGLAQHLGWPVMILRMGFVLLSGWQFLGVLIYAALWLLLPLGPRRTPVGLQAASRSGMRRPDGPGTAVSSDLGSVVAVCAFAAGMTGLMRVTGFGWPGPYALTIALAAVGVALVWRQADHTVEGWQGSHRWGWIRVAVGSVLLAAAVASVVVIRADWEDVLPAMAVAAGVLLTALVAVAPWVRRSHRGVSAARERDIVADTRAEMAAHLHDSVLQSLALIQRQAGDQKAVATIARRQERELRHWLFEEAADAATFRTALTDVASEIEAERQVQVDLVVVGDAEIDQRLDAVVRAAREAILNAAKHSGQERVDVYAEVTPDAVEVFVRDRGVGFTPDEVGEDRMGVRGSIVERMARHGGSAVIRSTPGEGTEVRLEMSR